MSESLHNRRWRQKNWDYSREGTYLITLSLANRSAPLLGSLQITPSPTDPLHPQATILQTPLGERVACLWEGLREHTPGIKSLGYCVMPDHFHGILWVQRPLQKPLGEIIRGFKIICTQAYRELTGNPTASALWAPGFDDKILSHAQAIARAQEYIADNPRRLALKRTTRSYFTHLQQISIPFHFSPDDTPFIGSFTGLGNRFLLNHPHFYQVQVSRRDFRYQPPRSKDAPREVAFSSSLFEEKRTALIEAATQGAVIVSPFLSQGEQELCRFAVAEGFPVIQLRNQGLPPLFKPKGRFFDLCARGNYLLLAPIAWEATAAKKTLTREDALVLNRIAQCLCGSDAQPLHYHGAQPAAIDEAVRRACAGGAGGRTACAW